MFKYYDSPIDKKYTVELKEVLSILIMNNL